MILKGKDRSGATQLANHLMNAQDNDHVILYDMRGFIADDLHGAFNELQAVSRGTKCKNFMFSLSLSPPENERVPVDTFDNAVSEIEEKLNLINQPRVVIFHEKEGRRHAHCVWSRVDVEDMKAIEMPFYKLKLRDVSRSLYFEHGWKMPRGLMNSEEQGPLNYLYAEYQQAKRANVDPRMIKQDLQDCWFVSDTKAAFSKALETRGYYLAKGDRRGFVAVSWQGEIYSLSKWLEIKSKNLKAKLGDPKELQTFAEVNKIISNKLSDRLEEYVEQVHVEHNRIAKELSQQKAELKAEHHQQHKDLAKTLELRRIKETTLRSTRLPSGLRV